MGRYGLRQRNERDRKLVEFCKRRQLYVTNTRFTQDKRRRYTWKQPGDIGRCQIDYIMTKTRFWKSVRNAKSYLVVDMGSDHDPVVAKICITLKKVQMAKARKHWDREKREDATL